MLTNKLDPYWIINEHNIMNDLNSVTIANIIIFNILHRRTRSEIYISIMFIVKLSKSMIQKLI